jgi:hypothetical protein
MLVEKIVYWFAFHALIWGLTIATGMTPFKGACKKVSE